MYGKSEIDEQDGSWEESKLRRLIRKNKIWDVIRDEEEKYDVRKFKILLKVDSNTSKL